MLIGLPLSPANRSVARSRRSMLETLVRHLGMVRLTVTAAMVLAVTGCSGLIDDGGTGGLSPEEVVARKLWLEKALPTLTANCQQCHNGSRENIGFLVGNSDLEIRDTLLAYEPAAVNLDAPASSRLLTKGPHEGPALTAIQTSDLLEWVNAEKDAATSDPDNTTAPIETAQFLPQICTSGLPDDPPANPNPNCPVNKVPLDGVGATGATINFVAQALGSGLYVTNLKLVPGTDGAYIEHPLFVSWPMDGSEPKADTIDRFYNVKLNLQATATAEEQQIGGGTAAFVGFFATDKITIHFKDAKLFQPDDGGGMMNTGCKVLDQFKTGAVGPMQQNCLSCHGGQNQNATTSMDITGIDSGDDAMIQNACNQVRTRVNFQDIPSSGVFLATTPGNNNHPFTFNGNTANHDAFVNALTPWITAERDAP